LETIELLQEFIKALWVILSDLNDVTDGDVEAHALDLNVRPTVS
jgi:hypothetical protein